MISPDDATSSVAILILAAGTSSRMGGGNHKLLSEFDGVPLIRVAAESALRSMAKSVAIVVGHRQEEMRAALTALPLQIIENLEYASGMGSSLAAGVVSVSAADADGVMILLADMPRIKPSDIDRLIKIFEGSKPHRIVRATSNGKPGHPVILPSVLYGELRTLTGDVGAKEIIKASGIAIAEVELGEAAGLDVDTAEAIVAAGGRVTR
ncbi:nucleotidyltransferase family protein [Rhizobium mesosinicum]|uniref:Nucleotidyltransferase family protein n=1 Tax=Rhizobium mesosinicum TaxID=335017 RepID=A0ABS7GPG1_9HYPH|nr:nucleotidyltransferase family protein [Rhizobium mesosinicum]MBW9051114.1 nucleotidyltransferase family protein [Rhizobium mesosinicum]